MPAKGRKVSEETRRKMSEAQKRAWRRRHALRAEDRAAASRRPAIHISYGHAARSSDPEDRCLYCDKNFAVMAYTYFGAPVCGRHWDGKWRKTEDGACDPPFMAIKTQVRGRWL